MALDEALFAKTHDTPSHARTLMGKLREAHWVFVLALVLVCGLSVFIGVAVPLGSFAHDTFFFLDNAYRVAQGQIPHRDFSSAWGPVMFLIDAAGLLMSGMQPSAFGTANAVFGAIIAIWAFLIVRPGWSPAMACAIGIYTLLLVVAPFPIGIHPFDFGYAMDYNRYGYALFGLIMLECVADMPLAQREERPRTGGAISTGAALGLLFFLKISYAFVAAPFVAALMLFGSAGRLRRIVGAGSGFAIVTALMLWYLRFDGADMVQDLAMAASARRMSLQLLHPISRLDFVQAVIIIAFAMVLLYRGGSNRMARLHGAVFCLLTVGAGYLLLSSNQQVNTFPLNGYAAFALIGAYRKLLIGHGRKLPIVSPGFPRTVLVAICILPFFIANASGLTGAAVQRLWPRTTNVTPLELPAQGMSLLLRPVTGTRMTETAGAGYAAAVKDGVALLRRHLRDHDGVLVFDEINPFNYILARRSPKGGFAAAAYNYIFSDNAHPTPERFFGDTPDVLVRKYKQDGPDTLESNDVDALMRLYGPQLRAHFTMTEETEHWALWRRTAPN